MDMISGSQITVADPDGNRVREGTFQQSAEPTAQSG
jgi:hypothetical protein